GYGFDSKLLAVITSWGMHYFYKEKFALGLNYDRIDYNGRDSYFNEVDEDTKYNHKDLKLIMYSPSVTYRVLFHENLTFMYRFGLGLTNNSVPPRYDQDGLENRPGNGINQRFILKYC